MPRCCDYGRFQGTVGWHDIHPIVQMFGYSCAWFVWPTWQILLFLAAILQTLYKLTSETKWRRTLKPCVDIVTAYSILFNMLNWERIKVSVYFGIVILGQANCLFVSSVWLVYCKLKSRIFFKQVRDTWCRTLVSKSVDTGLILKIWHLFFGNYI